MTALPAERPILPRAASHRLYPQPKLYLGDELPYALHRGLGEGGRDVIVAPLPVHQGGLREAVLFDEPLHLAVPLDHALAARDTIKVQDLEGVDLPALGPGHRLADEFADPHDAAQMNRVD